MQLIASRSPVASIMVWRRISIESDNYVIRTKAHRNDYANRLPMLCVCVCEIQDWMTLSQGKKADERMNYCMYDNRLIRQFSPVLDIFFVVPRRLKMNNIEHTIIGRSKKKKCKWVWLEIMINSWCIQATIKQ